MRKLFAISFLFIFATLGAQQQNEHLAPNQPHLGGGNPSPPFNYAVSLEVFPIPGLTSQTIPAPSALGIALKPMAGDVTMKAKAQRTQGNGANQEIGFSWTVLRVDRPTLNHDGSSATIPGQLWESTASGHFANAGSYLVTATPIRNGTPEPAKAVSCMIACYDMYLSQVTLAISETPEGYTDEGRPIFWVNRNYTCTAITSPAEFAGTAEWALGGVYSGAGATAQLSFSQGQETTIGAFLNRGGYTAPVDPNVKIFQPSNVAINELSHEESCVALKTVVTEIPDSQRMYLGLPVTYRATCTPAGYDQYIKWNVNTMDDMHNTATPSTGMGPTFTTVLELVEPFSTLWLSTTANEASAPDPNDPPGGVVMPPPGGATNPVFIPDNPTPPYIPGSTGNPPPECILQITQSPMERMFLGSCVFMAATQQNMSNFHWTATPASAVEFDAPNALQTDAVLVGTGTVMFKLTANCNSGGTRSESFTIEVIDLCKQNPVFNSPVPGLGALGIVDGCQCPDDRNDVDIYGNNIGSFGSYGVLPHSGQVLRDEMDLFLAGRDQPTEIKIMRRHLSCVNQEGDKFFGAAWAFNYRQTIEEQPDGSLKIKSFGRTDSFTKNPDFNGMENWHGTCGRLERVTRDSTDAADCFWMRTSHGTTLLFDLDGAAPNRTGILKQILSPNGNKVTFEYEDDVAEPIHLCKAMTKIIDSYGRDIIIHHDNASFPKLITSISDFSSRRVQYEYVNYPSGGQDNLQLSRKISPAVSQTGNLNNDFINGKPTDYTYRQGTNAKLINALTSIIYPAQVGAGDEPRLAWSYDEVGNSPTNSRVISMTVGNQSIAPPLNAGGSYTYEYLIFDISGSNPSPNTAVVQCIVTDRLGNTTRMDLSKKGHILAETIVDTFSHANPAGDFNRAMTYTEDGDLITAVDPMGTSIQTSLANPLTTPRNSHANEINNIRVRNDSAGADQEQIHFQVIYEPVFNKPFKVVDPRAVNPANDAALFTTTYVCDYMEDLATAKTMFAEGLGLTETQLQALFDAAGIVQVADVNGGVPQFCGNVIQIIHPPVELPPEAVSQGFLASATQAADELFTFNIFGQQLSHRDAELNLHERVYFSEMNPDGNSFDDNPTGNPVTGGFLRFIKNDTSDADSNRNSGHPTAAINQIIEFQYTTQDTTFPENLRGLPTAVIDARGVKSISLINRLDQTIVTKRAHAVEQADQSANPEAENIVGLTAFDYEQHTYFDLNDNVAVRRVQNKDKVDGTVDNFVDYTYTFDILDQVLSESLDSTGLNIINSNTFDAGQNRIGRIRAEGDADSRSEDAWTFDERYIEIAHTRGVGASEVSTTSTMINRDGFVIENIDAEGSDKSHNELDGHNRLKTFVDRVDNETVNVFDEASNVIRSTHYGPFDGTEPLGAFNKLSDAFYSFDNRNRMFKTVRKLFHYTGRAVGMVDDGELSPISPFAGSSGAEGEIISLRVFDRANRVIGVVDADGDDFEEQLDGLGRSVKSIDPLGNMVERSFDDNSNLLSIIESEVSSLITSTEIFTSFQSFDALNRQISFMEPNGQLSLQAFDSQDNLILVVDALGNETDFFHDALNRKTRTRTPLSVSGENASIDNFLGRTGTQGPDFNQGGGDGVITIQQEWDQLHRVIKQIDDNENETKNTWDDLSRQTAVQYGDNSIESWTFNADSELTTHTSQKGDVETWTHDADSRPIQVTIALAAGHIGTTEKTWGYDGMDRVTESFDNNGTAGEEVTCLYLFNSISQVIRETQQIAGFTPAFSSVNVDTEWQGTSRKVSTTFPDGDRKLIRTFDPLDRLTQINDGVAGPLIVDYQYVGPFRDLQITYGNGTILSKLNDAGTQSNSGLNAGYDLNRRHLRHEWTKSDGVTQITSYVNTYNGPGGIGTNRRITETREHFASDTDTYTFDSKYRMLDFNRVDQGIAANSTRALDGANKMLTFSDEGDNRVIEVDGVPAEAGRNQYSRFGFNDRNYDDNGATTQEEIVADEDFTYIFDYDNRLIEIRDTSTMALLNRYIYAADDRKVVMVDFVVIPDPRVRRFVYDGWRELEERTDTDFVLREYVDGRGIDEHVQVKHYAFNEGDLFYYHCNSQGTVGAITAGTASAEYQVEDIVERYTYSMLGEPTIYDPNDVEMFYSEVGNKYKFQGRRFEPNTNLYYFRNRYYNFATGEFMTPDPARTYGHGTGTTYEAFGGDGWNNGDAWGLDFTNDSEHTVYVKPEEDAPKGEKNVQPVLPGETYKGDIDGFADPSLKPGEIFKVPANMDAGLKDGKFWVGVVEPNNSVLDTMINLLSLFILGGWKDAEEFSKDKDNWKDLAKASTLEDESEEKDPCEK